MYLRGDVFSRVLDMTTGIAVVGPGKIEPGEPYRVCYLLHGMCGKSADWVQYTLLPFYARNHRVLFVMPEVGRSFYTDMARGQRFFTYVADELPELCGSLFRISAEREDTAVFGASMGGYGALKCAFRRPERFGRVAAFAPACLYLEEDLALLRTPEGRAGAAAHFGDQLPVDFMGIFGDDFAWREEDDVGALARRVLAGPPRPDLFLACGEGDYLAESYRRFRRDLEAWGYPHEHMEGPGEHSWLYFDAALRRALAWAYGEGDS